MLAINRPRNTGGEIGTVSCEAPGMPAAVIFHVETSGGTPSETWETLARAANFRPPELARNCQVSLRTLQRFFRKQYNTTISEWMRAVRLEQAKAMVGSAESIKWLSFELGYKQPSHFTRDFKMRFGVTPSAFRWPTSFESRMQSLHGERGPERQEHES